MTTRILAVRLLTGEVLHDSLPTKDDTSTQELNGPGGVSGTILADVALQTATDGRPIMQEWSTGLFVVEDGVILCGGPLTHLSDSGSERKFIAAGYTNWPNGQPYLESYQPDDFEDPVVVYRELWRHLQAYPDGNLGVQIDAAGTYMVLSDGERAYSIIPTEYRDCGGEMTNILTASRIDYVERHSFVGAAGRTSIRPAVQLYFPRAGGNRHNDLRFEEDTNVVEVAEVNSASDEFSNDITVIGQGEGYAAVDDGMVVRKAQIDGRVRRAIVVNDASLTTAAQVAKRAEDEYLSRRGQVVIESFTIRDHPNAPLAAINLGDDVILNYTSRLNPGPQTAYLRITGIERSSSSPGHATILCAPSASFSYFPTTNPYPDGGAYVVQV